MYSIKEFAKLIHVTPQTLRNWDKSGKLVSIRLKSKHRRYTNEHLMKITGIKNIDKLNVLYVRESTKQQKNSLIEQERKLKEFCLGDGIKLDKIISEYGSALNYNRKGLKELIYLATNNQLNKLIVYYKDRLVRFGFEFFEELSKINNFEIIIVDNTETDKTKEQEFAEDLISIIHHFSMKIYGSRSYKKKIKNAENNIKEIKNEIIKS